MMVPKVIRGGRAVFTGVVLVMAPGVQAGAVAQAAPPAASAAPKPAGQAQPIQKPATQKPAGQKPAGQKPAATNSPKLDALIAEAAKARDAKELDRAVDLYKQALAIRPTWAEGQWNLGTALYELERFGEARDAFRRVVAAHPQNGTAWAFKGLCEFRLTNYDTALADLVQAKEHGVVGGQSIADVARYHSAILLTRIGQFDQALLVLNDFGLEGNDSPGVIEAMGLAVLRMPMLPADLPGPRRDMVLMAGRARYFQAARMMAGAQSAYELLTSRYADTPNVHYAYGVFLLAEQPEKAIELFQRELKVSQQHVHAKLQIAFAHIRRGDYDKALPWAQQAASEAPTEFVARTALGQVLLETGDVPGAIRELEAGVKLAPDSPIMHFTLARAYRRAGRSDEAEKAQQEFTRLNRLLRESQTGAESVGGIPLDPTPGVRTP
jgi:tetratricopeptide (TPR) repeat protein